MPGKTHCRFLAIAILAALAVTLAVALPGVSADGDEDQAPPIPEKAELKYPNLGSHLDQLVTSVEDGETTAEDAAAGASMHREESVAVTIYLSGSVDDVVQFLQDFGGDPRNVGEDYIEAYVPMSLLGPVSEQPGVLRVREIVPPEPAYGDFTSQGVEAHGSSAWNDAGHSGQGVKVGVIDVGFEGFSNLMGQELPTTVEARCYTDIGVVSRSLTDCEIGSVHGTGVAETVIDIAPEVSLYIANPGTAGDLREAVDWMVSEGVSVINHSVTWRFDGPGDGTSPSTDSPLNSVDRAVANDMIWVNSAGNNAQKTWFGDYADTDGDDLVSFAEPEIEVVRMAIKGRERVVVQLRWEDDWDSASTDLDLYLYNTGTRMFTTLASRDEQSGGRGQVPLERISFALDGDSNAFGIVVNHHSGGIPDWIQLMVRGVAEIEHHTGSGSISSPGESHNPGLLAVGAAHYYDTDTIASYSSRGPTPDGRVKPDIVGTACGEGASYEPYSRDDSQCWFPGTSQAAPHVAGMAALVRQRFPGYTPAQVADYLKDHARQRETPDPNNTWGHGFAQLPSPDREALEALYNATGGANWTNNDVWLTNAPIGQWYGVTTDASGRVTRLDLADNQLTGSIPDELGSLANLEELWLSQNQLTGAIPTELGSLAKLKELWLSENQLTGEIPVELGSLSNLVKLVLWGNALTGEIPVELGTLANLEELSLSDNQLSGMVPQTLAGLTVLESFRFYNNLGLCAPVDDAFQTWLRGVPIVYGSSCALADSPEDRAVLVQIHSATDGANWTNKTNWLSEEHSIREWYGVTIDADGRVNGLFLGDNQLTGEIPPELGNLANLERLRLFNNQLAGEIPVELGTLANLTSLSLSQNQLTGAIPTELGSLANLEELYLWGNELTGTIPTELGSLANLEELSLSDNQLAGEIPVELGNLANLKVLALGGNELTGTIPTWLGSLANLEELYLWGNELTGEIPSELGNLANLVELHLADNQMTGEVPVELGNLANLKVLALGGNELTGTIPTWLGSLANLEELYLWGNELTGEIPTELGSLANLEELSLSDNQLAGEIPVELGTLANLTSLSLSQNQLSGAIPTELGSLANLEELWLSENQLSGEIPVELGSLSNLVKLVLWGNELAGEIPVELGSLASLEVLSLSDNQLSGVAPQTLAGLTMLESFIFHNNPGLCAPIDDAFQTWLGSISTVLGSSCAPADSPEDRAVLVQVHSATDGANWTNNTNWLSEEHFIREWYGVTNDANGRVHGLFLGDNQLAGEIPPELGSLANLELLSLSANQLTGEIPAEMGSLANLRCCP